MLTLLRSRVVQFIIVGLLGVLGGMIETRYLETPNVTTMVVHDTKTITVDKPILIENVVTKLINDPKQAAVVKKLFAENSSLKAQVTALTTTVADLQSHGGTSDSGTITKIIIARDGRQYQFKDWQIVANYSPTFFEYTLRQQFKIVTSLSKGPDGKPIGLVRLYQTGKDGSDVLIPTQTTVIIADPNTQRWLVSPRFQAGFGIGQSGDRGGIVSFQWLKHGSSTAAEDLKWSVLSPTLFITSNLVEPGLLPAMFNIGSVPHLPFTNVWVGPFVGLDKSMAFVVSATF